MFQFQNQPPTDPRGNSLPLVRTPVNKAVGGIVTSSDLFGTRTHYYRGRTIPCDDESCPACDDGFPWRWHAYVSLFGINGKRQVLFEMTAKATEPLIQYREAYGTLRGCYLIAKRANMSPNSRVIIETKQADLEKITLPPEPNILEALAIIWNIEIPAIAVEGINKQAPAMKVSQDPALQRDRLADREAYLKKLNGNGHAKTD